MTSPTISLLAFACVFGGALIGTWLRRTLPEHHLNTDSKEIVRLGTGLVGTMTALVLGLLVASAKNSYDTERSEVISLASKIVFLDRTLAHYGPDSAAARETLRKVTVVAISRIWPPEGTEHSQLAPLPAKDESLHAKLHELRPTDETQQLLKAEALRVASEISQMRWLMYEQSGSSISSPFLIVLVLWLMVMFVSFGMFAPPNATVLCTLLVCAMSVACAIFLVLELDHPFEGIIRISSDPMQSALDHLGQ
ncbi:MAG: DUF4239 domain-containing protein [Phycisphaerae bacterium]|nr:DUF4239 domain-containing protein [Phycisphaerae bacterium]